MCAFVSDVPAGKPVAVRSTSKVAAETFPAESFVRLNVIVAVAEPLASSLPMGGTSLAGSSCAANFAVAFPDGDAVVPSSLQDARPIAKINTARGRSKGFICLLLLESVELPTEVEPEVERFGGAAPRHLREGRAECVRERQREHVGAHTLLEAHTVGRFVGRVAGDPR